MSTPDEPGAVTLTPADPAHPALAAPVDRRPVIGMVVAGLGVAWLFVSQATPVASGLWTSIATSGLVTLLQRAFSAVHGRSADPYQLTMPVMLAIGIVLVAAGALIAVRPRAPRGAVIALGAATLVAQFALAFSSSRSASFGGGAFWETTDVDLRIAVVLYLGLGLTWFAGRGLLRSWWAALLPALVFAAFVVVNVLVAGGLNGPWRYWSSTMLWRAALLLVNVALVVVVVLAERRGAGPSREERDAARAGQYAATQAQAAAAAQAAQVAQIQQWQAVWVAANPGQPASAAPAPPVALALPVAPGDRTNTMAVLALVFGLLGSAIIPVILGHVSLGQIARTGERGRGMAIAGLVLGYLGLAVLAAVVIVVLANS